MNQSNIERPSASREATYFHGTHAFCKNFGVVLETFWDRRDRIVHTVIDFSKRKTFYVLQECFKIRQTPETRSQRFKDERAYAVFENVNYEADDDGYVREHIARNQKKWEVENMGNDVFVVSCFILCSFCYQFDYISGQIYLRFLRR